MIILKKYSYLILIIIICSWLFIPKIDLIEIGGYEQGVRFQDLIFLIGFFLLLAKKNISSLNCLLMGGSRSFYLIFYMFLSSCLSIFILNNGAGILFFTFRWLEYFVFGAMVFAVVDKSLSTLVGVSKFFIVFNLFHSVFNVFVNGISERYGGFTSGPWEISTMLILLFIGIYPVISRRDKLIYFLMILVVILLAKARMQLLAIVFIFIVDKNLRRIVLNPILFIILSALIAVYFDDLLLLLRFEKFRFEDIVNLMEISKTIDRDFDYHGVTSANENIDASLLGRFVIWMGFINKWWDAGLYGVIFGIAPGAGGVNVDGFYVRLITEFGFIGIVLILYLVRFFYAKIDLKEKGWLAVALVVICITLDPFTSQKIFASLCISLGILMKLTLMKKNI